MARKAAAEKDLTEERQAMAERALSSAGRQSAGGGGGGGGGGSPADGPAASTWWVSHLARRRRGRGLERMRGLRRSSSGRSRRSMCNCCGLSLPDERGKLTKAAIKVCAAWSSYDSTSLSLTPTLPPSSFAAAALGLDRRQRRPRDGRRRLRALLQAARAQLDKQVEVRMKQAAARTSSQGNQRLSPNRDMGKSPSERRVRLGDL